MRTPLLALWLCGCGADDADPRDDDTGEPAADTDSAGGPGPDTHLDTDTEPPKAQARVRILHVAVGYGSLDMHVNGAAEPVLDALDPISGTGWTDRPVGTFAFAFALAGTGPDAALYELPAHALLDGTHHTFIVHTALDGALAVLPVLDDSRGIAPTDQRIRWTHVARDLPPFDVVEVTSGAVFAADLSFGDTVVSDHPAGPWVIGLDYDGDGVVEIEFEGFDLSKSAGPGKMVDLQLISDGGEPSLVAYQPWGSVAVRGVTELDTGAPDTGLAPP